MADAFKEAAQQVAVLKVEFDKLTIQLPKLRELIREAKGDLKNLQVDRVKIEEELEALKTEIRNRTDVFNNWQQAERISIKKQQTAIEEAKIRSAQSVAAANQQLSELKIHLAQRQEDLEEAIERVTKDEAKADDQLKVQEEFAASLIEREQKVVANETDIGRQRTELEARIAKVIKDEVDIKSKNTAAQKALETAKNAETAANTLLQDAKDRVADMDAREGGLEHRAKLLDAKEDKLRRDEIALNDRRSTMISNGTLAS